MQLTANGFNIMNNYNTGQPLKRGRTAVVRHQHNRTNLNTTNVSNLLRNVPANNINNRNRTVTGTRISTTLIATMTRNTIKIQQMQQNIDFQPNRRMVTINVLKIRRTRRLLLSLTSLNNMNLTIDINNSTIINNRTSFLNTLRNTTGQNRNNFLGTRNTFNNTSINNMLLGYNALLTRFRRAANARQVVNNNISTHRITNFVANNSHLIRITLVINDNYFMVLNNEGTRRLQLLGNY